MKDIALIYNQQREKGGEGWTVRGIKKDKRREDCEGQSKNYLLPITHSKGTLLLQKCSCNFNISVKAQANNECQIWDKNYHKIHSINYIFKIYTTFHRESSCLFIAKSHLVTLCIDELLLFCPVADPKARADSAPPSGQVQHCGDKERSEFPAPWDPGSCRSSWSCSRWTLLLETSRAVQRLHGGFVPSKSVICIFG